MSFSSVNNFRPSWGIGMHRPPKEEPKDEPKRKNPEVTSPALDDSQPPVNEVLAPKEKKDQKSTFAQKAQKRTAGLATAVAIGAQQVGLGAKILHHGAAIAAYSKGISTLGWLGAYRPVQYLVAQSASKAAAGVVGTTICGASLGAIATVGTAVLTAMTVAQIGVGIHNAFIAKEEEDKISLNPLGMAQNAFDALVNINSAASAAAASTA